MDSSETERIPESKEELFELLERPVLAGIPLLVLGNKNDLPESIPVEKLIDMMSDPSPLFPPTLFLYQFKFADD